MGLIVGVDIGGHHIAAAPVDLATGRLDPARHRHLPVDRDADGKTLVGQWASAIDAVIADVQGGRGTVAGVGIAIPGPFDYRAGTAWFAGNGKFGALHGVDVGAALAEALAAAPPIRFLNDAAAFAIGADRTNRAASSRSVALTLGTGFGAAFVEQGVPVVDARPGAVPDGGCLWHLPHRGGIADDAVSVRWLLDAGAAAMSGRRFDGVAEMAREARDGGATRPVFAAYGCSIGEIAGPWLRGFGAETLVIGGRIAGAYDLFGPALRASLARLGATPSIIVHEDTEGAAILGAAACFDPRFWLRMSDRLPRR